MEGGETLRVRGGKGAILIAAISGFGATLFAMVLSLVPPEEVESALRFEAKVLGGLLGFLALGWIFYLRGRRTARAPGAP